MRVGLSVKMAETAIGIASGLAGRPLCIFYGENADEQFLVCPEEFAGLDEGQPHIEKVREAVNGYISGTLEIHVQRERNGPFISSTNYAVLLERRLNIVQSTVSEVSKTLGGT